MTECAHCFDADQEVRIAAHVDGSVTLFQRCVRCDDVVGVACHEDVEGEFAEEFTVGDYTFRIFAHRAASASEIGT